MPRRQASIAKFGTGGGVSFILFPKFPAEIQDMIWQQSLPDPQIHEVRIRLRMEKCGHDAGASFPATAPYPTALKVCKTSRAAALRQYTLILAKKAHVHIVGSRNLDADQSEPCNKEITADNPEVREYFEMDNIISGEPKKMIGWKVQYQKRSYIDLQRDTVYINYYTFDAFLPRGLNAGGYPRVDLRKLNWNIDIDDSNLIKHLSMDYVVWNSVNIKEDRDLHIEAEVSLEKFGGSALNDLEWRLWQLQRRGAFQNLESLTLVFYDHGDPKLKQQYFANHKGPITFVEEIDTGPVKRRKNGNRLGPWHTIGLQTLAIAKGQTGTMEAVQEKIEYLKAKMIGDIAELREKKPDIKIPKIIWRYALRDGKFRTY